MQATLYIAHPATGRIFTARTVEVDVAGQLADVSVVNALRAGGWLWYVVRDFGIGSLRWRDWHGGCGWGGRQRWHDLFRGLSSGPPA